MLDAITELRTDASEEALEDAGKDKAPEGSGTVSEEASPY